MLKLSQITILDNDMIVKGFEPEVATTVGDIAKSDESIQRDKDSATVVLAEILRIGRVLDESASTFNIQRQELKVGMIVMIPRNSGTLLTMPIEGYKEKELAFVSQYSAMTIIETDNEPPLM